MMNWIAALTVAAAGLWLVGLAAAIVFAPQQATRLLNGFASSARAHFAEQFVRIAAGAGMVFYAAEMRYPKLFGIFGWVLIATSAGLLLLPWTWHKQFAEMVIPVAIRFKGVLAVCSLVFGVFVFWSMFA